MSLHSMTCAQFETLFDEYVDEMLEPVVAEAVSRHLASCAACDREVTRWQQARILLSSAVTDLATAIDVSALRRDVGAALGFAESDVVPRRQSAMRESAVERDHARRGGRSSRREASPARREAADGRRGGLAAAWRFASAATASAVVAAAAVLVLSPGPQTNGTMVASPVQHVARNAYQPAAFRPGSKGLFAAEPSRAAYTPPPLARPEISDVSGLEAAPGHLVSTWVQPRTNARVIWVQDRGLGAPVRTAGLDR